MAKSLLFISGNQAGQGSMLETKLSYNLLSCRKDLNSGGRSDRDNNEEHVIFDIFEAGEGGGQASIKLTHELDQETGSSVLRLTCALWVYNCLGVPIALKQARDSSHLHEDEEVCHSPRW